MKNALTLEIEEVIDIPHYLPSVTVIIPFEPKMSSKNLMQKELHSAYTSVKHQLFAAYTEENAEAVLNKLDKIMSDLDYTTHKKSICIFVSPIAQKLIYFSIPVEPRIIIDESFRIRDILSSKKQYQRFLLLLFSGKGCRLYLGDSDKLIKVVCNIPADISTFENDIPERVSNFSDPSQKKETVLHKFLHSIDNSLALMLESYPLPMIVMGTKRLLGHFKKLSHHAYHIVAFIHGNFMESSEADLLKHLKPYISNWNQLKETDLLMQIDRAKSSGALVSGIQNVYRTASRTNNRLLIVEENYTFKASNISDNEMQACQNNSLGHVKDAVDDVIENVLRSGGDVEFVRQGILKDFDHIALIKYYNQINEYNYS